MIALCPCFHIVRSGIQIHKFGSKSGNWAICRVHEQHVRMSTATSAAALTAAVTAKAMAPIATQNSYDAPSNLESSRKTLNRRGGAHRDDVLKIASYLVMTMIELMIAMTTKH